MTVCPACHACSAVHMWKCSDACLGAHTDIAALFDGWEYPFESNAKNEPGRKKDLPLCEILKYFQHADFRQPDSSNLHKFGIIGFDRFGRAPVATLKPYARRHVYKVRAEGSKVQKRGSTRPVVPPAGDHH